MVDYRVLAMMLKRYPLKNINASHGVGTSHPVVRLEDGKHLLAAFIYPLKADGVPAFQTPKPTYWETVDPSSAALVNLYSCAEYDFCNESAPFYPVSESELTLSALDFMSLYEKLDVVRASLENGKLETGAYQQYFSALLSAVPEAMHPLYQKLSNL